MNNQSTPLTRPCGTELATKAATCPASSARNANAPTDFKTPTDEVIRLSAYLKWEAAGKPNGNGVSFWLAAETGLLKAADLPILNPSKPGFQTLQLPFVMSKNTPDPRISYRVVAVRLNGTHFVIADELLKNRAESMRNALTGLFREVLMVEKPQS